MKLFGTDGIRGTVPDPVFQPQALVRLAQAIGITLGGSKKQILLGGDTRHSFHMVSAALSSGFLSLGFDVVNIHVASTPMVAFLVQRGEADFGVVISASHNPSQDNGIKLFSHAGYKLAAALEEQIEDLYFSPSFIPPLTPSVGQILSLEKSLGTYEHFLLERFHALTLKGTVVALDCAHGALHQLAPRIFQALGATVVTVGCAPDGWNINEGVGSTHLSTLEQLVQQESAHVGFSFDGDGDRVLAITRELSVLDGEQIMALLANSWKQRGLLTSNHIVANVMANGGFQSYLKATGFSLSLVPVGDRWVAEEMRATGAQIGGEGSGHIILDPAMSSTGDGLLIALAVMEAFQAQGGHLQVPFMPHPQVLMNVPVKNKDILGTGEWLQYMQDLQTQWADRCSILVRPSGTEPLVRVMVESEEQTLAHCICEEVCQSVKTFHETFSSKATHQ